MSQMAMLVLASAIALPAAAQQSAQPQSSAATDQPAASAAQTGNTEHEGFWGHVNPFARKKWVNKRIDPLKGQLNELDEVNAKNSKDIQDVDGRAQSGIHQAQSTADAAAQAASAASGAAQAANASAQQAAGHVDQLNTTVTGLDQFHSVSEADVAFRGGSPVLSASAKQKLDSLATTMNGQQGYVVEIEAHSSGAGSVGIQNSERLAEAVKRYLVVDHQIPVYRLHAVALGNARNTETGNEAGKPVRTSSVHLRLMENSLAAQGAAPPHGDASLHGAEQP